MPAARSRDARRARATASSSSRDRGDHPVAAVHILEEELVGTGGPAVEAIVMRDDGAAGPQGLDQRRVGAADDMTMHIGPGVEPQRLHDRAVVDRPGKEDFGAGGGPHGAMVGVQVVELSQHDQRPVPRPPGEGLNDLEDRVVGLDPGDRNEEAVGGQVEAGERRRADGIDRHAAIRDGDDRLPAAPRGQMIGDGRMVGD